MKIMVFMISKYENNKNWFLRFLNMKIMVFKISKYENNGFYDF